MFCLVINNVIFILKEIIYKIWVYKDSRGRKIRKDWEDEILIKNVKMFLRFINVWNEMNFEEGLWIRWFFLLLFYFNIGSYFSYFKI